MQTIEPDIYESAKIDGVSTIRRVFTITIPLLKNVWFILATENKKFVDGELV